MEIFDQLIKTESHPSKVWFKHYGVRKSTTNTFLFLFRNPEGDEFMEMSSNLESYFKGFMYFPELRHTGDSKYLSATAKQWESDFAYFVSFLEKREVWYVDFMVKIEQR